MTLERAAAYIDSGSRPQSEAGLGLRMWAAFVNDNGAGLPTFSSWETTNQNPAYYLSLLQSGRRVLPTFFYSPSLTEATWNANAGRTSGAQALAEYCNAHRLPICLRMDNLEGAFYTDAQYQKKL